MTVEVEKSEGKVLMDVEAQHLIAVAVTVEPPASGPGTTLTVREMR